MSPVTVTWNLRYTNTNPNPDTICDHCRQFIGHVFPVNQRPLLPMHPSCYCIYEPTTAPVTWDVDWEQYFADLQENDPQAYRQWVQRAAWFLRKLWPLGIMEALRQAAERYNEEEYEPRATQGVEHMYDTNPVADMPAPATPDAHTPASGENIGNHPSPSQNAALRAPQSVTLGPVTLQANQDGPPQYDAILVQPGWIRKSDGTDSDWLIPADVLQTAADSGLFASVSHYVDHPKLFGFGWPQSHSIRDLAGLITDAHWDHELGAVRGTIRLYDTDAGQLLQTIYDQILTDQEAGLDVPPIGLSAVVYRKYKIDKESGKKIWTEIRKVESVDLVYEPGAAGYIRAALNALQSDHPTLQKNPAKSLLSIDEFTPREAPGSGNPQPHLQASASPDVQTFQPSNLSGGQDMPEETPRTETHEEHPPAPEPQTSTQAPVQDPEQTTLERIRQNIETLNGVVARLSSHVVAQAEQQTIEGMGEAPRSPTLYGGYTGLDRVEMALDAMLSGTRPPDGVRPLTGIRELYMLLSGDYELTGRFHPDRVHLANVTTSTMAGLVANRLNKVVVNMFQQYDRWWAPAVTIRDFATLQDVRWITLGGVGELPTVAEGAAYTEMTWDDQTETDSFVKKGGYLGITLETIDKDDTSRVMAAPRALAQAAWLTLGKAIAEVFTANSGAGPAMSDGNNLFDNSNHSNYGSTALSYAAWKATVILMMKYTEINSSERLGALTRPRLLWVPIDLEDTAIEILAAGEGEIGTADYHVNPETLAETHRERVRLARNRVVTVPFWTNTTDWVAQADPAMYPGLGLGFRYGRTPEIFSVADPRAGLMFTNDTMPIKVRFFFAVGPTDYRAFYKHNV